jgi:hypothetical protein
MALFPNELVINDDWKDSDALFKPKVNGMKFGRGYDPESVDEAVRAMLGTPDEIKVIPKSEWSARIKQQEETKSRTSDVLRRKNIASTDQDGDGYCHTADTEVLTEKGWVAWPDYNWTDPIGTVDPVSHALQFQTPFEKHVYDYDGPMIHSTNRRIDFGVTPDHQMYVRKWDERKRTLSDQYSFVKAGDLGWYTGLMHAPESQIGTDFVTIEVPGDRRYEGDDFMALLGLIVSDGYAGGTDKTRNWVSFASFRADIRDDVAALANRNGFHESPSKPGIWIRYDAAKLAQWLRENSYVDGHTGAKNKKVPTLVKCASPRQIKHFLHWFDDRNREGRQFYSISKQLIDDLQELHLRIGKRSHIGDKREPRATRYAGNSSGEIRSSGEYTLTVGEVDQLCLDRKKHIETDRYKGPVYCAAVPNHTLVTRRNGSVLISSNCWMYSGVGCVIARRAVNNQKYVRLNAHSSAAIIKKGRNEGGWCGLSSQFLMEHGVATFDEWPEHSRDTRHDTPETRKVMAKYRVTEAFIDLTKPVHGRNMTFEQVATCLLRNIPVAVDFNWWTHSVLGCDLVEIERGSFGIRIRNSWTDSWGDKGFSVLEGSKTIPNGAVAIATVKG